MVKTGTPSRITTITVLAPGTQRRRCTTGAAPAAAGPRRTGTVAQIVPHVRATRPPLERTEHGRDPTPQRYGLSMAHQDHAGALGVCHDHIIIGFVESCEGWLMTTRPNHPRPGEETRAIFFGGRCGLVGTGLVSGALFGSAEVYGSSEEFRTRCHLGLGLVDVVMKVWKTYFDDSMMFTCVDTSYGDPLVVLSEHPPVLLPR